MGEVFRCPPFSLWVISPRKPLITLIGGPWVGVPPKNGIGIGYDPSMVVFGKQFAFLLIVVLVVNPTT